MYIDSLVTVFTGGVLSIVRSCSTAAAAVNSTGSVEETAGVAVEAALLAATAVPSSLLVLGSLATATGVVEGELEEGVAEEEGGAPMFSATDPKRSTNLVLYT